MLEWLFGKRVYAREIDVIDGDSINWRKGGWGENMDQSDGALAYRLAGLEAPPVRGQDATEIALKWGNAAKTFLKEHVDRARVLKLKDRGPDRHGRRRVATLYIDGTDAAEIMIKAKMAVEDEWDATDHLIKPDWDELWEKLRPLG
jgi:endonuclease YncB( thermonuclease family)